MYKRNLPGLFISDILHNMIYTIYLLRKYKKELQTITDSIDKLHEHKDEYERVSFSFTDEQFMIIQDIFSNSELRTLFYMFSYVAIIMTQ